MTEVLNWAKALENLEGDEEILTELATVFLDECAGMMAQIRDAIDKGDAAALQRTAHSLKSSARIFIARPAADAAFQLETMGQSRDLTGVGATWMDLCREIERLNAALADRLGSS